MANALFFFLIGLCQLRLNADAADWLQFSSGFGLVVAFIFGAMRTHVFKLRCWPAVDLDPSRSAASVMPKRRLFIMYDSNPKVECRTCPNS